MDKHKSSRTITIKLNGVEKVYPAPQEEIIEESLHTVQGVEEFLENELERNEIAAAEEIADESFDWILPEITGEDYELKEYTVVNGSKKKKFLKTDSIIGRKNNEGYKSFLFAVLIAILVGTSFGAIMLKLVVSGPPTKETVSVTNTDNTPSIPISSTTSKYSIKLQPFVTFIVQEGVYSSKESAEQASKSALGKGVPSKIINIGGKEYLFLAAAETIDNAKAIGSEFAKLGFEKYAKQITFPEKTFSSLSKEERDFLQKSSSIFYDISSAASRTLIKEQPAKDTLARIRAFSSNSSEIKGKSNSNAKIKQLHLELMNAAKLILAHGNVNDPQLPIKSEQHLLEFLLIYSSM